MTCNHHVQQPECKLTVNASQAIYVKRSDYMSWIAYTPDSQQNVKYFMPRVTDTHCTDIS